MSAAGLLRLPPRILFGSGSTNATGRAVSPLGRRAVIFTDETIAATAVAQRVRDSIDSAGIECRVFSGCVPDVPLTCVAEATAFARERQLDFVVGLGGGSCLDVAKAVALALAADGDLSPFYGENRVTSPLVPIVAIPTTAGTGSEVTPVAVIADPARELKVGISSPLLVPAVAICDPEATLGCPPAVTGFSGIDALVHAVEAFCAPERANSWESYPGDVFRGRDVLSRDQCLPAIELIGGALERAFAVGSDLHAREAMMLGSLRAGIAFAHQGTASAHALQYPVGAATGTPHGLGVGLLVPYTLAAGRPQADPDLAAIAVALGVAGSGDDTAAAIAEIERLGRAVGTPGSLAELGVRADELPRFAHQAAGIERLVRNSPRPMAEGGLLDILNAAWRGSRPGLSPADIQIFD